MADTDLSAEMRFAAGAVRQRHIDALLGLGVAGATIASLGSRQYPFGVMEGVINKDGAFVPGDGPLHLIQPVMDGPDIIDLVAWRSMRHDRWGLRMGTGWALGVDNITEPGGWDSSSAHLIGTPLNWLRAGAADTVVLDWEAREIEHLRHLSEITCSDRVVAKLLTDALKRPQPLPSIRIEEMRHVA